MALTAKKEVFKMPNFGFVRGMNNEDLERTKKRAAIWLKNHLAQIVKELESYFLSPLAYKVNSVGLSGLDAVITGPGMKILVTLADAGVGKAPRSDRPEFNRYVLTGAMPYDYPQGMAGVLETPDKMDASSTFTATRFAADIAKDIWNRFYPQYNQWLQERSEAIDDFTVLGTRLTAARIVLENTGLVTPFEPLDANESTLMLRKLDTYNDQVAGDALPMTGTVKLNSAPTMVSGATVDLDMKGLPVHLAKDVLNLIRANNFVDPHQARAARVLLNKRREPVSDFLGSLR